MKDFILQVPEWKGEMLFDYEIVSFFMIWVVLFCAIMLCVWGYKFFQTMCLLVLGSLCGVVGIFVAASKTDNLVLRLIFFVIFVFFGLGIFFFLSMMVVWLFKRLGIANRASKMKGILSAVIGSILVGITVYQKIYHNIWVVLGATFILGVWSILHGRKCAAEQKPFYTYDDLYKLKPLVEVQKDA